MPLRFPAIPSVVALLLVLAGCSYEATAEYSRERTVPAHAACPDASTVAAEENADDAELIGERPFGSGMKVCEYEVEDEYTRRPFSCGSPRGGALN